jgi:MFS superfamily sulfate permease-like transporter
MLSLNKLLGLPESCEWNGEFFKQCLRALWTWNTLKFLLLGLFAILLWFARLFFDFFQKVILVWLAFTVTGQVALVLAISVTCKFFFGINIAEYLVEFMKENKEYIPETLLEVWMP